MVTQMKVSKSGSRGEIKIVFPASVTDTMQWAISGFLNLAGHEVVVSKTVHSREKADELFPKLHPGLHLRGLRVRESISHKEMAERLGLMPEEVSGMENGTLPISPELAMHIGKVFNISHRVFLP